MGEHAAVYGRPALVAAVDLRARAVLEVFGPGSGGAPELELHLPDVGVRETLPWSELVAYADSRRLAWNAYAAGRGELAAVLGEDPAHVVKTAMGELLGLPEAARGIARLAAGARLEVRSELPVGAGFGSSAAVAVAVLRAAADALGLEPGPALLQRLAVAVERRQHGKPSGVDTAAVIRGGLLWAERRDEELSLEQLDSGQPSSGSLGEAVFRGFRLYDSGPPAEPTGEVVAAVAQQRASDPAGFDRSMDEASRATVSLRRELESAAPSGERIAGAMMRFGAWLESLGVVPAPVAEAVRRLEAAGAAAKISGAGSLAGPGAGSLVVYHRRPGHGPWRPHRPSKRSGSGPRAHRPCQHNPPACGGC